jgi:hypothetical protein
VRLFDSLEVGLESNDEHTNFEQHDMHEKCHIDIGTPHYVGDEPSVDCEEAFPGETRVKNTRSLDVTFLVDDDCAWMILGAKFRSWANFPWFFQKRDSLF